MEAFVRRLQLEIALVSDSVAASYPRPLLTVFPAEAEMEVESTSAISSEVQSHSQNPEKERVRPKKRFTEGVWNLVAGRNPDGACTIAV